MQAIRVQDVVNPDTIDTNFPHLEHMYTGVLSKYYYRRFDHALRQADLSQSDRVLVVGVGTGVFALSLSKLVDNLHVSDVVRETPLFSTTRQLFDASELSDSNVTYAAADATQLPYSADSFDAVFALDVLEHIPSERDAISELARVNRPDGRAIVSSPIEVGPAVVVRELYRELDGGRRNTESLVELAGAAIGNPILDTNTNHRGYDYRQTRDWLQDEFEQVSVDYCPISELRWTNPTAIMTAY